MGDRVMKGELMRNPEGQGELRRFSFITGPVNFEVRLLTECPEACTCSLKVRDIYF